MTTVAKWWFTTAQATTQARLKGKVWRRGRPVLFRRSQYEPRCAGAPFGELPGHRFIHASEHSFMHHRAVNKPRGLT